MKLYGMGKSRSFRALWALEEAGLDYEYVGVSFGSNEENGTASEGYRAINFEGKVPTLIDDDLVLIESAAIVNYIAAKSKKSDLIPTDIIKRAKFDEATFFILAELEQGLWTNGKHRFALPEEHRVSDILPTATFEFNKAVSTLNHWFGGEGYILGDTFTVADILLAHTLNWAQSFKFDVPENLLEYKKRMYAREACVKALAVVDE